MSKRRPKFREPAPRQAILSGRLALITGANRGIGLAIARALAREGCNLIVTGRDQRALAKACIELDKLRSDEFPGKLLPERLNVPVLAQSCDVRSPDSVDYLFALVRGLHKPLDIQIGRASCRERV